MSGGKRLLWVVELGGYPDFTDLYRRLGFEVATVASGRKAHAYLKANTPDVVVAEFNFQPDFRDRTSNLESLLAVTQRLPATRVVVFYEPDQEALLEKLRARFPRFSALPYPLAEASVAAAVGGASASA